MSRVLEIHNAHPRLRLDAAGLRRAITVLDEQFQATAADLPRLTANARRRVRLGLPLVPDGELSLAFFDDRSLARLHGEFLDDPTTTDVITFEGFPEAGTAGEICVSADTAARFAREHQLDFSRELSLYVVHGWLHLAGYDDLEPLKKRRMRAAEARALRLLGDRLPHFSWKK
jgi:probable rRNA maturation factor